MLVPLAGAGVAAAGVVAAGTRYRIGAGEPAGFAGQGCRRWPPKVQGLVAACAEGWCRWHLCASRACRPGHRRWLRTYTLNKKVGDAAADRDDEGIGDGRRPLWDCRCSWPGDTAAPVHKVLALPL